MVLVKSLRRALLLLVCCGAVSAAHAATTTAYVHFGAILLGEAPAANHDARRPRVGYLPIGTRVYFDPEIPKQRIFNYSEDVQDYEYYIHVRSDIGFSGYLRDDLITELGDTDIVLPLRYNLIVKAMDSSEVAVRISRAEDKNSSRPAEILAEAEDYYAVRVILESVVRPSSSNGNSSSSASSSAKKPARPRTGWSISCAT